MEETIEVQEPEVIKQKGKPGRKPKLQTAAQQPSIEALAEILMNQFRAMSEQQGANLEKLGLELRKPTELEQKKLDEEHRQLMQRAAMSVEMARQKEATDFAKQSMCPHKDKLGDSTFWGQVNSDGYVQPFCSRCGKMTDKWRATPDQIANGVLIRQWKKDLTVDELNQYAKYANSLSR